MCKRPLSAEARKKNALLILKLQKTHPKNLDPTDILNGLEHMQLLLKKMREQTVLCTASQIRELEEVIRRHKKYLPAE